MSELPPFTPERAAQFAEFAANHPRRRHRSHPAEVTADRLADHAERWHDKLTGSERDALSVVRNALQDIAEGLR